MLPASHPVSRLHVHRFAAAIALLLAGCTGAPQAADLAASQGWTPVELGITRELQLAGPGSAVYGLRFDLVSGQNRQVIGLDINGWWGCTDAPSGGIALALAGNEANESFIGLQVAGGLNLMQPMWRTDERTCYGAQIAVLANAGDLYGIQRTHDTRGDTIRGLQVGLANGAGTLEGVQLAGLLAWTTTAYGVQLALFNVADSAHGLQLGLVNCTRTGGLQLGLLNWNDHGLLPMLPLFNFSVD
jgi:hypothetical protein